MGIAILIVFIACGVYVQTRGEMHHAKLQRRITDHANFLAPLNCLFYLFSRVKADPYADTADFPELRALEAHWTTLRDEALELDGRSSIRASDRLDDIGFNSFFRSGWKRFYLAWYGTIPRSARQLCPRTVEMLEAIPSVKGAMFALLPAGSRLAPHRDPFAGSLRYHLGLVTPNDDDCFICVDGRKHGWRDGEAVMFDETYLHYAENNTGKDRIVLFLDVRRPVWFAPVDWLNRLFSRIVMGATVTRNMPGDQVGFINRSFTQLYRIRSVGRRIKAWSKPVYYLSQYAIYAGLIYLVFF